MGFRLCLYGFLIGGDKVEKFDFWTRRIFMGGILFWLALAIFDVLSLGALYAVLGLLVCFLGIKNTALLIMGSREERLPQKVSNFLIRYGTQKGLAIYVSLFIALYLVIGFLLIFSGIKVGL